MFGAWASVEWVILSGWACVTVVGIAWCGGDAVGMIVVMACRVCRGHSSGGGWVRRNGVWF